MDGQPCTSQCLWLCSFYFSLTVAVEGSVQEMQRCYSQTTWGGVVTGFAQRFIPNTGILGFVVDVSSSAAASSWETLWHATYPSRVFWKPEIDF